MNCAEKYASISLRVLVHYIRGGLSRSAAELAFYLLFSVFPLIMIGHSILSMIQIPDSVLDQFTALLPSDVQMILASYMRHLRQTASQHILAVGIILTMFFMSRAVRSMMHTFREIYGQTEKSSFIYRMILSVAMTILCILMILSSLVLIVFSGRLMEFLQWFFPQITEMLLLWKLAAHMTAVVFLLVFLLVCYRLLPGVQMRWREALPGALTALCGWYFITRGFALYVDHIAKYSILYGSIGAIIVMMGWLYISSSILLLGAVFNHELKSH